jgi:hypothetical protein
LIDCYLPEQFGIRSKFFEFVAANGIRTFHFIVQTHPDYDHYHGMQAVIEHFLGRGEKIGYYIDTGLTARRARDILRGRPAVREYELLQNALEEWDRAGQLKLCELAARHIPLYPEGFRGQIELIPIGPDPDRKRKWLTSDLRKLAKKPDARLIANELSLVVVLSVKIRKRTLSMFLGADAAIESVEWALDYWKGFAAERGLDPGFDAIKIPHHASIASHTRRLCAMGRPGQSGGIAAVSAGTRGALPDREVLRDYLVHNWLVFATTTRGGRLASSLPLTLADQTTLPNDGAKRHSIRLSWTPARGLLAEPAAARITLNDLVHYETAGS